MPLAATLAAEEVFEAFWSTIRDAALMHGPTFMANPLACAAANASLDLFEREPKAERIAQIEAPLRQGLEPCRAMAGVVDVRVRGAIGVVQLGEGIDVLRPPSAIRRTGRLGPAVQGYRLSDAPTRDPGR